MATIATAFKNVTATANGDLAFKSTGNPLIDLIFYGEYLTHHLDQVDAYVKRVKEEDLEKLFVTAMFIRDPRFGLGWKDLGRKLLGLCKAPADVIVKVGCYKDLWKIGGEENIKFLYDQILADNYLAKRHAPRFGSDKNKAQASYLAHKWGLSKQDYGKFVKCDSVERLLSEKRTDEIDFGKIPALAGLKYGKRFANGEDTKERYEAYKSALKRGAAKFNTGSMTPYDLYKARNSFEDPTPIFDELFKKKGFKISCMPIVDTSSSMENMYDAYGKALALGHFLSMCSIYDKGKVLSFSSEPQLIDLLSDSETRQVYHPFRENLGGNSEYHKQIRKMHTGDCSNTDFGKVMDILQAADELPDYLVVLSDMQFDNGSGARKRQLQSVWKNRGITTKLVWWNLAADYATAPETDEMGNIFLSGYNPTILQYMESGFSYDNLLDTLLNGYLNQLRG